MSLDRMTCVALDMDETLGHFAQASQMWRAAKAGYLGLTDSELEQCLLEVPGLFNPDLGNVMRVLSRAKKSGKVDSVVVYTNNVGDRGWPEIVTSAANRIAGHELITDVIAGYKGEGDPNEPRRTTSRKVISDLCRCAPSPHYIFVDNEIHPGMISPIVDYVKVSPHIVTLAPEEFDAAVRRALGPDRAAREVVSRIIQDESPTHRVGTPFSKDLYRLLGFRRESKPTRSNTRNLHSKNKRTRRK